MIGSTSSTSRRHGDFRHALLRKEGRLTAMIVAVLFLAVCAAILLPEALPTASGLAELNSLSDVPWIAESDQTGANFGYSVSSAGDVNNDGFGDVVVGANNYDNGETDEGRALLFLGSASGPSSSPSWTAESDQAYARFGYSVSFAGDVNGDGHDDVVVGAANYDNGETDEGRAYLYLGSAAGLATSAVWMAEGNLANAYFGHSVEAAGDVNNDGYDDVLVTAPSYDNGEADEGRVYLFHGSPSGPSTSPSWTAEGNQAFANFGRSVASAGDVDKDGYDDVVVGAYYYDNGENNEGSVFLYRGSSSGLSSSPSWIGEGNQAGAWFGSSVSSAGDVNNDGYSDVMVGALGYDNPEIYEGRAYLYLGSASGLSSTPAWVGEGNQANAYYGMVSTAGDVNNDGFGDVIVGAYFCDNETEDEGCVYLYLGSSSGLSESHSWTAESDQYRSMFGVTLSCAGDVNGDMFDDVIIGAYDYENGQPHEGRSYLYYGYGEAPPVITFDLVLVLGWNFVSIPLVDHGYKASTLGLVSGEVLAAFDPATGTYKTWTPGSPAFKDFHLISGVGYWIYCGSARTIVLEGYAPSGTQTTSIIVPAGGGWATFGLVSLRTTYKASDMPSWYTGGDLSVVAAYDPATQTYKTWTPGSPAFKDFSLLPGMGYWIYCSASGTLSYEA
jgi:fibrillarin-like rRNA methylase